MFRPERFLAENKLAFPNEKGYYTFGFGRRVCSGQALAEQGTYITVARLLWGFTFRKALSANDGREIDVDIFAYTNGLNMRPEPFECRIDVRPDHKSAILREGQQALDDLRVYEAYETQFDFSTFKKP